MSVTQIGHGILALRDGAPCPTKGEEQKQKRMLYCCNDVRSTQFFTRAKVRVCFFTTTGAGKKNKTDQFLGVVHPNSTPMSFAHSPVGGSVLRLSEAKNRLSCGRIVRTGR